VRTPSFPCALTIAGLDPGGGAGIAADLRAFTKAGVFGCAALALTTVQSTRGLQRVVPLAAELVVAQAREVLEHQYVRAVKLGALGSRANVQAIASLLHEHPFASLPLVVDPVIVPSRGPSNLLDPRALATMRTHLLPRATLVTANTDEATALTKIPIRALDDARVAARALCDLGAAAAMVKGGHLHGRDAIDVVAFADGSTLDLRAPRLPIRAKLHGGGCTFASLVAGRLAIGYTLRTALSWAKRTLQRALENLVSVGGPLHVITF
jgi:hydroxymethylpyrimidine/phosphomethylpyrimidine kinase